LIIDSAARFMITIIIPVFNSELYIRKALNSVCDCLDFTFEVIVINDGSTDGSAKLLEQMTEEYDVLRIIEKKNGGVSSARNVGLMAAKGEWVLFVDADDTVEPDFVERMCEAALGQDLVVCAYDSVSPSKTVPYILPPETTVDMDTLYEHTFCTPIFNGGCCNKAFKTSILRQHQIFFDEQISVGEDMLFLAKYYLHCRHVAYVNKVLYHYTVNPQSLTQQAMTNKTVSERDASVLIAMDALLASIHLHTPRQQVFLRFRLTRSALRLWFLMVVSNTYNKLWLRKVSTLVRVGLKSFILLDHSRRVERCAACAVAISPRLVFKLSSLMLRIRPNWVTSLRQSDG